MKRSFLSTIRGKLLSRTLLVVLLPVVVIGGAAIYALGSLSGTADEAVAEARATVSEEVVGARVSGVSEQIAREIAIFLDERVDDAEAWSTLNRDISRPFPKPTSGRIAVKVINHLGDEVMKVFTV